MGATSAAVLVFLAIYGSVIRESMRVSLTSTPEWNPFRLDTGEAVIGLTLANPNLYRGKYRDLYLAKVGNMNIDVLAALGQDPELTSNVWARGKLAQYVSGIVAARQEQTPSSYYGYNLVNLLQKQLPLSVEYFRTNRFALSWMAIALCQQNETFGNPYEDILTSNPGTYRLGIDEASMITMACLCLNTERCITAAQAATDFVLKTLVENNNLNVYSLGLAAQALIATNNDIYRGQIRKAVNDIRSMLNIPATMTNGLGVSQILPPFADKSFLDIVRLPPLSDRSTPPSEPATTTLRIFIIVEDRIVTNTTREYAAVVSVPTNPTLLQAMAALQAQTSSDFSFETMQTSLGPSVITVNGITRNETNMFWRILMGPDMPLQQGVAATFPMDGDQYIFNLTFFQHP